MNFLFMVCACLLHRIKSSDSDTKYWWKKTIIYEIVIPSFKDSDGDGIGDINGITSKLDHFVNLNVETLWISPCYPSPMKDMGYDITNFIDINPMFGTLADFDNLVSEMKKRSMKLILDLIINHSSHEHPWFQKSIARIEPYTNFYVWKDPNGYDKFGKPLPPNNWMSIFQIPTWEWNNNRKQFYYHAFYKEQPDFDLKNNDVLNEIKEILSFWLNRGVDGFRMDATFTFIEEDYEQNEDYFGQYTINQPGTYQCINKLRTYLDETANSANSISDKIFAAESVQPLSINIDYYGNSTFKVVHYPFNFDLQLYMFEKKFFNAIHLDGLITSWLNTIPNGEIVNWVSESHDLPRVSSMIGEQFSNILVTLTMLLPGAVSIYYGQEICMTESIIRPDLSRDKLFRSRDPARTPMQWDDSFQTGFSSNKTTWLPVNPNYWYLNVESQKKQAVSCYNMFKKLSDLRRTETMLRGDFQSFVPSPWVYVFTRKLVNHEFYIIVINLNMQFETVKLRKLFPEISRIVEVVTSSINSGYKWGSKIRTRTKKFSQLGMKPVSALVLKTENSQ